MHRIEFVDVGPQRRRLERLFVSCVFATALSACQSEPSEANSEDGSDTASSGTESATSGDASEVGTGEADSGGSASSGETSDATGDGTTTDSGTTGTNPDWSFGDHFGLPNIDDDDGNDKVDWFDALTPQDDDPRQMVLGASKFANFGGSDTVRLTLAGDINQVRVWHDGEPVLGDQGGTSTTTYTFSPSGGDEVLTIEFASFLDEATLTLEHLDGADAVVDSDTIRLLSSPLILNHHLQPAETVYMTDVGNQNAAMVNGYAAALGSDFIPVPGNAVNWDVWMQDEPEFATSTAPGGIRLNTIIDSIRDRGLDSFPEAYFGGEPDWFVGTWGTPNQQSTKDSFGNLEISPPVTVNGTEYPFGRIYYGNDMHPGMVSFLESQKIQDPIEIDTDWLCVGHVDEFLTMVADPNSPKGFKVLYADTTAGVELLQSMNPGVSLPRYGQDYGYSSVGEILADDALITHNADVQTDILNPLREQFKNELGLDDSDFIFIPTLFEELGGFGGGGGCANTSLALIPGTVNLIVANRDGDSPILFVPDPFMRGGGASVTQDAFANDFVSRMPDGWEVTFLDNWDTYHVAAGEVHCGTNVIRTPIANWWEVGLHLLD